jgi:peptide/nickel transport system substrate-binding protein
MQLYQQGLEVPEDERIELGRQIFKLHADQVWSIGVVGFGLALYGLYYAKNDLGNIPDRIINSGIMKTPSNLLPMTLYYK